MKRSALALLAALSLFALAAEAACEALPAGARADSILVEKAARRLTLFAKGQALKSYVVSLGREPLGPKRFEGDGRTPEGHFTIDRRNPKSAYHLALHVSYPLPEHTRFARSQGKSPGGDIMIHGMRNGIGFLGSLHRWLDWTQGCIALTDEEMEELWRAVPLGTPIEIRP